VCANWLAWSLQLFVRRLQLSTSLAESAVDAAADTSLVTDTTYEPA
jgi:hypothetical protein